MSSCHLSSLGPSVRLTRGDREHIDDALVLENGMGDVGGKPPIDTVAVEENRRILGSRHLGINCLEEYLKR